MYSGHKLCIVDINYIMYSGHKLCIVAIQTMADFSLEK